MNSTAINNLIRVTQLDIAQKLGISQTAVGLAFQNNSRISPKLRETVRQTAKEMGYFQDPFLSALAEYRTKKKGVQFQGTIGWINHWRQPESLRGCGEFEKYWHGAAESVKQFGYQLQEIVWPLNYSAKRFQQILLARGIRGILIPPHRQSPEWGQLDCNLFCVIRFGMSVNNIISNVVESDQHHAIVMAIKEIYNYGYRRIGLILSGQQDRSTGGNYYGGYLWAQKLFELKPPIPPLFSDEHSDHSNLESPKGTLQQWLKKNKPDAILTTDSEIPGMIKELGYRIPKDIAVAGTSVYDIPVDAGIDQHPEAVGRIAVEMLMKQMHVIEPRDTLEPCRILVKSTWQDGKTLPYRKP